MVLHWNYSYKPRLQFAFCTNTQIVCVLHNIAFVNQHCDVRLCNTDVTDVCDMQTSLWMKHGLLFFSLSFFRYLFLIVPHFHPLFLCRLMFRKKKNNSCFLSAFLINLWGSRKNGPWTFLTNCHISVIQKKRLWVKWPNYEGEQFEQFVYCIFYISKNINILYTVILSPCYVYAYDYVQYIASNTKIRRIIRNLGMRNTWKKCTQTLKQCFHIMWHSWDLIEALAFPPKIKNQ